MEFPVSHFAVFRVVEVLRGTRYFRREGREGRDSYIGYFVGAANCRFAASGEACAIVGYRRYVYL